MKKYLDLYRVRAQEYGYIANDSQLGWAVPIYVGETDESAVAEAKAPFREFPHCFARMPIEFLLPPGYTSRASMKRIAVAKKAMFGDLAIEPAMEMGMMVCGSAASVRDRLIEYFGEMGFGNLIALLQFGTLPAELTDANMGPLRVGRDAGPPGARRTPGRAAPGRIAVARRSRRDPYPASSPASAGIAHKDAPPSPIEPSRGFAISARR